MKPAVLLLALSLALPVGGTQSGPAESFTWTLPPEDLSAVPEAYRETIRAAAREAGIPARILAGIAFAESSFRADPHHPDPLDRGMFGLHESQAIRAERVARFGEYDPLDPGQAARVAAGILAEHRETFRDWRLAIAAYRQGAAGVRRDGAAEWYVVRVLGL